MFSKPREWIIANALLLVGIWAALMTAGFAVQTIRIDGFQIDLPFIGAVGPQGLIAERDAAVTARDKANAAHKATKATYREAQAEASRMQAAKIAAEIARQERINNETREDYNRRLADIRSRAERLRAETRAGAGSEARSLPVSEAAVPPQGVNGKTDCNAVFAGYVAGQLASLEARIECGERAEKEALAHNALIAWVEESMAHSAGLEPATSEIEVP